MSKIKVNSIEAATGSTVTLPSGQTLDLSSGTVTLPNSSVNLTTKVTGTLPVANGGTGLTTLGSASQVLRVNSGATALEFGSVSAKFVKATLGYNNSTRTVYGVSQVVVTGQDFVHPTGAAQTISFTKDSATSNIVIHFCLNVGNSISQHSALLWSTGDSVYRHLSFDGSRNGTAQAISGADQLSGAQFFSGLSSGSKTYYISLGRNDDGNDTGFTLNPNLTDSSDKGLTPTSQVIVYEIEP
jgi:hypothetical protein